MHLWQHRCLELDCHESLATPGTLSQHPRPEANLNALKGCARKVMLHQDTADPWELYAFHASY